MPLKEVYHIGYSSAFDLGDIKIDRRLKCLVFFWCVISFTWRGFTLRLPWLAFRRDIKDWRSENWTGHRVKAKADAIVLKELQDAHA